MYRTRQVAKVGNVRDNYYFPEYGGNETMPNIECQMDGAGNIYCIPRILQNTNPPTNPNINTPVNTNTNPPVIPMIQNNNPTSAQCSCLTGTAYIDTSGNCGCSPAQANPPIIDVKTGNNGQIIYYQVPNTSNTSAKETSFNLDSLKTLATNNPLLTLGLVAGLGFLIFKKK